MYQLRQLLLLLFSLVMGPENYGQNIEAKPIQIVSDSIGKPGAIFLGEVHGIYEGQNFKMEVIKWAHQRYGIKDVVMEMGSADAHMFNQYFRYGDTTLLSYYGHGKEVMERLQKLETLYNEIKCTFWGIDFEREGYIVAVLAILNKHAPATQTELYRYLNGLVNALDGQDDANNRKKHVNSYEKARSIFIAEQQQLREGLAEDYATVERILLNPATERKMKERDKAMAQNLAEQLGNKPFICIVGAGHIHFQENTLLRRYLQGKKASDVLVVNMLCKNCYNTSYYGTELSPLAGDFDEKHEQYFKNVCDEYYKAGAYVLVNQRTLAGFPAAYYPVPTYYAVFKDQPKW